MLNCSYCPSTEAKEIHLPCVSSGLLNMCLECLAAFFKAESPRALRELKNLFDSLPERRAN